MSNNLKCVIAPPINVEFQNKGKSIFIKFNVMTLQHIAQLTSYYGEKQFNNFFLNPNPKNFDIRKLCEMLTILIPKEDQLKLKSLETEKVYFEKEDKEVELATTVSEKLATILSIDIDFLIQLIEGVMQNVDDNIKKKIKEVSNEANPTGP